ncbi:dihydrolipoyl dehydrogenase family protein [Pontibacillus marinus]|uniref:FAD-dependent pyridine nucleotide-disulfide oxidoreductase n=1 Tax=Pontibacillus marinus BH030004 = DSM 16465 TaxID=1385511 RepID=A0A0A5GCW3_9BACI|nr:FAD-dependent oxidoreductase [Pontibacillus marinus]KGX89874.1 FAD-dependent pyridine nucleotide-disulfide oxidoreductase [Pontibacillus marinus BH030004 = DSM 16465]
MKNYDLIIVGGGAGGLTVAAGAASLGAKTALIDKREDLGGDCLHYGCVPSKALIEVANEVYQARNVSAYGVHTSGVVDMKAINERIKQSISHIQEHDSIDRFRDLGIDVFIGGASFQNEHEVELVGGDRLYGKRIVVSTGSRPNVPPIQGLDQTGYITNETVFDLDELPKKLVFIGGGPIGLELAQAFARLGSEVTVLEAGPAILGKEDQDVRKKAQEILEREMKIITHAKVEKTSRDEGQNYVHYSVGNNSHVVETDQIFLATGRTPNTDTLQLEQAGVSMDKRGFIKVDDTMRTSVSHIFAVGDVNGSYPFTHIAGHEGKTVVQNAVFGLRRSVSYENIPWNTYLSPEVFHLGLTQEEAQNEHGDVMIYQTNLDEVDRYVADHASEGFLKIITTTKGHIVGAHAIGKGVGDWMQVLILAVNKGMKVGDLSTMIYPYPNHTAAIEQASNQYWRNKLFSGVVPKLTKTFIRWFR